MQRIYLFILFLLNLSVIYASINLLKDSSFEERTDILKNWFPFLSGFYLSNERPYDGSQSIEITPSDGSYGLFQITQINYSTPNTKNSCNVMMLGGYARTEWQYQLDALFSLKLNFEDEEIKIKDVDLTFQRGVHDWNHACKIIFLPKGIEKLKSALLYIIAYKTGENYGTIWFDDVVLKHHHFEKEDGKKKRKIFF